MVMEGLLRVVELPYFIFNLTVINYKNPAIKYYNLKLI